MGRNSVVTENGGIYKITQPVGGGEFADYRRWYLNSSGKALAIADSLEIARVGSDGYVEDSSVAIDATSTIHISLCINRDEDIAYILFRKNGGNVYKQELIISTMLLSSEVELSIGINTTPIRAIISRDEKIIWGGSNDNLYKMDLDGSNFDIAITSVFDSFALSSEGYTYSTNTGNLYIVNIIDMTIAIEAIGPFQGRRMSDGFVLDNIFYASIENTSLGTSNIISYNITTKDFNTVDLTGLYGVVRDSESQFNASGADNFATFSCTIGSKQTVMQCNLGTLECMPARTVNYDLRQIEYSNDTSKPIQRIGTDTTRANNCDWKGLLTSSEGATGAV